MRLEAMAARSTQPRGERVGLAAVTGDLTLLWLLPATIHAQAQRRRLGSASLLQLKGSFPGNEGDRKHRRQKHGSKADGTGIFGHRSTG